MSYSDQVALILLCAVLFVVVVLACWGIVMLVSDWREASRHARRIKSIINR